MNEINATNKSLKKSVKWIKVEAKTIKVTQNPGQFYGVVYILTWVKPWRLKEYISALPVTWKSILTFTYCNKNRHVSMPECIKKCVVWEVRE